MLIRITAYAPTTQKQLSKDYTEEQAARIARTALLKLQPMDEASIEEMTDNLINKVRGGSEQTIENTSNKNTLRFARI